MSDHHQLDTEKRLFAAWNKYMQQEEFKEIREQQTSRLKHEVKSCSFIDGKDEKWLARAYEKIECLPE